MRLGDSAQIRAEEAINIVAEDLVRVGGALEAPSVTIVAGGSIDTPNVAIIQGTNVNLTASRLGTSITPVQIQADNIHIKKLNGDIDIRQSIGIGTSVQITGPPDGETINISYNSNASQLTLEGSSIFTSGDQAQDVRISAANVSLLADKIDFKGIITAKQSGIGGRVEILGKSGADLRDQRGHRRRQRGSRVLRVARDP